MKKIFCLFFVIALSLTGVFALAEDDMQTIPGESDVKEEEAVETALSFFEEMLAFSRREWPTEVQEMCFAPGEMKTAETEENCWFIVLRNEMPLYAVIRIHGKTGEVAAWACSGQENLTHFYEDIPGVGQQVFCDAMPESKEWLNAQALYGRACADFSYHSGISMGVLAEDSNVNITYGNTDYSGFLLQNTREGDVAIKFEINVKVPAPSGPENTEIIGAADQWTYVAAYSMSDGEILAQELWMNDQPQKLRMNLMKQ